MVYLNGTMVNKGAINPTQHKFIGMFRPPSFPVSDGTWEVYVCSCRLHLWTVQECQNHWMLGHMDIPQYIDI